MSESVESIFQTIRDAGYVIMKKKEFDEVVNLKVKKKIQRISSETDALISKLEGRFLKETKVLETEIARLKGLANLKEPQMETKHECEYCQTRKPNKKPRGRPIKQKGENEK